MPFKNPEDKLETALEWAAAGFYILPCAPDGKAPITANGVHDATQDADTIRAWWTANPEANIGCDVGRSGFAVIDVDDKGDKHGSESLLELERTQGVLPDTYTVSTPSGGRHLWFTGAVQNSVGRLGLGLDTRGAGERGQKPGYVLLPGSAIAGRPYVATNHADPVALPGWISDRLGELTHNRETAIASQEDTPENTRRAVAWLATREPAVEGSGGDQWTLTTCMFLRDMGISREAARTLVEPWNERCSPPWSDEELEVKLDNAYRYGQNEAGSKGVRSITEMGFRSAAPGKQERSAFYPYDMSEQDNWPEPQWIVPHWLQLQSTFMLFGPPGSYKSFVALDLALSCAYGLPALGQTYDAHPSEVVYVAGEDAINIVRKRRPAWQHARRQWGPAPFYLVREMPEPTPDDAQAFIDALAARNVKPKVVVLDTLSRLMLGLDLSGSADAGTAVKFISKLQEMLNCTMIVVHHTGKGGSARGELGSQVFRASFDTSVEVESEDSSRMLTLTCRKQKNEERPKPLVLHGQRSRESLVFGPILGEDGQPVAPTPRASARSSEIGQALKARGAFTRGDAINTSQLAHEILSIRGQLTEDDSSNVKAMHDLGAQLRRSAKGFAQYIVSGPGEEYRWAWIEAAPSDEI